MDKPKYECRLCDKEIRKICPGHYYKDGDKEEEWYGPAEIKFCHNQTFFLISRLEQLKTDSWPINPGLRKWEDSLKGKPALTAPNLTAKEYGIEISYRLEKCGEDGVDLYIEIAQHGISSVNLLTPRARQAFHYVSGYKRKTEPYNQWKRQRAYEQKKLQNVAFAS